ncbi:thermonuclease family protein [Halorussus salilacus]|uniref:thermonuclease family protein n=1 Tax=Halorussus salilacus TaxID=2953750 RepID=UPI00209CBAA8|nr:thermonuclease family protein [Halorussus salilacus]USZ67093.1 thermonuclease family protein [Halorussus salilacus]
MQRRNFLKLLTATAVGGGATTSTDVQLMGTALAAAGSDCGGVDTIPKVEFYSSASQVAPDYEALTDESVVAVWAEPSAENVDDDGNGDAYIYDDDTSIPLVSVDDGVYGFGAIMLEDSQIDFDYGNEELVLNAWDAEMGGSGTVLWDEGHGQYYDLSSCSKFESYAEDNGYTVNATTSLSSDLSDADGVVITSPGDAFSSSELSDLADFVSDGGALYLHDQSDYDDNDETQNLNDVAEYLDLAYRFNDDDVNDGSSNVDGDYDILTHEFNVSEFDLFADRAGIGFDAGVRYEATVTDVTDGDTVDVEFPDGSEAEIRTLGFDTAETKRNSKYEEVEGWEGIEDDKYLADWGEEASDYAKGELDGETVEVEIDPAEDVWDPFGRLLAYIHYDQDGDGTIDTLYNKDIVEKGYARVYGSNLSKHDELWQAERDARDAGLRVWQDSDPENTSEVRDDAVEEVFVPHASSVRTDSGAISASRVPVFAEETAYQELEGGVDYSDIPLVGVDSANRTALVGGLPIDEGYHDDASDYQHEVFLTNLIDSLSEKSGQILIEGGHGQFGEGYALSNEDAVNYQRYLEGQGIAFEQINDLTTSGDNALSTARAVIVTAPRSCYTAEEVDALTDYIDNGGSVVLMGAGWGKLAPDTRRNFNDLAAAIGTDLRLNEDRVLDDDNNVDTAELLYTSNLNTADFSVWGAYS